jgi:hypothetical protein
MNDLACAVVTMIGFAFLACATRLLIKSNRAKTWPRVQGTMLDSKIRESYSSGEEKSEQIYILYEYSVNGESLRSSVWRLGNANTSSRSKSAKEILTRYPIGARVMVHVNPENPKDAVLEPGNVPWVWFLFGFMFFVVGALCYFHIDAYRFP